MKFYTYFSNQQRLAVIVLMLVSLLVRNSWVVVYTLYPDNFEVDPRNLFEISKRGG